MNRAILLLMLCATQHAFAQGAPATVSFVARLADNGTPITGPHDLVLGLFDAATGGTALWTESRIGVQVPADGVLYLDLGSVTTLDASVFGGAKKYLEITLDGVVSNPRVLIESVPYAIRAGVCTDSEKLMSRPASDFQLRVGGTCPSGSSISSIDALGGVMCEPDDNTTYTAGSGLVLSGTQFGVDGAVVQARVAGTCAAGSAIRAIDALGAVTCQLDTNTTYTAGSGLILSGTTFSVDTASLQTRVSSSCLSGSAIRVVNADGTVTCESVIQNQSAAAQAYTYFISGTARTSGLVRSGSEAGTTDLPSTGLATYDGVVHRRIVSAANTAGRVIARTDNVTFERDGTNGGLRIQWTKPAAVAFSVACNGVDDGPGTQARDLEHAANDTCGSGGTTCTDTIFTSGTNATYVSCMIDSTTGHSTHLVLHRLSRNAATWQGFVESTFNQ
ncbi:MAG: hypothetical protein JWO36_2434 [Myxococcales bacterium]|nr:hypothetical protein [Myxococcales bacterium]